MVSLDDGLVHRARSDNPYRLDRILGRERRVEDRVVPVRDGYERRWNRLLRDTVDGAGARELPLVRLLLFGAMNSSVEWFDAERGELDAFAETITRQFWSGLSAGAAGRGA